MQRIPLAVIYSGRFVVFSRQRHRTVEALCSGGEHERYDLGLGAIHERLSRKSRRSRELPVSGRVLAHENMQSCCLLPLLVCDEGESMVKHPAGAVP